MTTDDPFLSAPQDRPPAPPPAAPASGMPQAYVPQAAPQPAQPAAYPPPAYQQPGYVQPGYAAPPVYAPQSKPKTWMNWVAFGCGLAVFFTCVSFIPAIVFGHLGIAAAKRGEADQKGVGIAGLVIGYVALAGAILYAGVLAVAFSSSSGY